MKPLAIIILGLTIAIGTYLNSMDYKNDDSSAMIEDTVESSMAAPVPL